MKTHFPFWFIIVFVLSSCEKPEMIPTMMVEEVYSGSVTLASVYFTDGMNGYVGGNDGVILVTHDGGNTWQQTTLQSGEDAYFNCISFPAHDTGWISGRENSNSMNSGPAMYVTYDGGATWIYRGASYDQEYSYFPSVNVGYRDAYTDYIEKSTDGGQTWNELTSAPWASFSYTSLHFINEDTGFVGTSSYEWRTTNAGLSWATVDFPSHELEYNGVTDYAFSDNNNGVAVFSRGDIDVTTDGGETWINSFDAYSNDFFPLYCVTMPSPRIMVAGGMNHITCSEDGGNAWQEHFQQDGTSFPGTVLDIHFYDEQHGFAVTEEGKIYRLTRREL